MRISDVHKTGLGSSAALITSLVSALLLQLKVIPADSFASEVPSEGRQFTHNVAQYVHCLAQGKVGSGFDVSAAAFGSQLYTRFGPEVIQGLMNDTVRFQLSASDLLVGITECVIYLGIWITQDGSITTESRLEPPS